MRIDLYLVENKMVKSRTKAGALIKSGLVFADGKEIKKASFDVQNEKITLAKHEEYVSRGAYKLLGGIEAFNLDFCDKIVLDMGASTGGFTQVALRHGCRRVYAVDVGRGQFSKSLMNDERVVLLENTDIRNLNKDIIPQVDLIVGDLSFISLSKVLPHVIGEFGKREMCILFKPQFECGREIARKYRGVIGDEKIHLRLLKEFCEFAKTMNIEVSDIAKSPITGGDGNKEYLLHLNGKERAKKWSEQELKNKL